MHGRPDGGAEPDRRAARVLRPLTPGVYAPTAVYAVGTGAVQPVLVLAAADTGMSHALSAAVLGLLGAVGVLTAPAMGALVGRVGGRRSMILGAGLAVLAAGAMLGATGAPSGAAVGVFIAGVAALAASGNLWALARQGSVADAVPPWARARALSLLGGMMRLGVLVGPSLGAGVIVLAGRRGPFAVQILMTLTALGLVLANPLPGPDPSRGRGPAPSAPARRADARSVSVVALAMICLQLLRTNRTALVPLWGAHLGLDDALVSATFAAGALVDVAMFVPSGRWMDRYGRLAGLLPALLVMGASLVLVVLWTSPTGFVAGTCLMGLGNGFGSGIVMTMGVDLAPSPGRERFLGWWQAVGGLGSAVGPFAAGALTAAGGLAWGMWATALTGLLGGAWAAVAVPRAYRRAGMDMRGRAADACNHAAP